MLKIHQFILTFGYSGLVKKAPGTFGSLVAVIFWFITTNLFNNYEISLNIQNIFWAIFLSIGFIYGSIASPIYAKQFNQIDHSSIVLDEVIAQILALQLTFLTISEQYFSDNLTIAHHLIFSFVLFRFFDIKKPLFIGYCDKKLKNGFGVMFDDIICAIIVVLLWLFLKFYMFVIN